MRTSIGFFLSALLLCGCASSPHSVFDKPASALVNTQWVVVNKGMPVLAAFHYAQDDEWVFFADVNPTVDIQVNVTLEDLLTKDGTIKELSDLPAGWKASRGSKGAPWKRGKLK